MIEMMLTKGRTGQDGPSVSSDWKLAVRLGFNKGLTAPYVLKGTAYLCDVKAVVNDTVERAPILGSKVPSGQAFSMSESAGITSYSIYTRPVAGVNTFSANYGLEVLGNLLPTGVWVSSITGIDAAQVRRMWLSYMANVTTGVPAAISQYLRHLRFYGAAALNAPNMVGWDTSKLNNMSSMLYGANAFNQDIGAWNTDAVTSMSGMFYSNTVFNKSIANWNVNKVTNIDNMFFAASAFNQDLSSMIFKANTSRLNYDTQANAWLAQNKPQFTGT